ncbi:MAG TPA: alpha/beta fold hydrolase [Terracidiphilus sp.]|nr:alpha/beta fold hydrolase [Terracidiphilus sp.]
MKRAAAFLFSTGLCLGLGCGVAAAQAAPRPLTVDAIYGHGSLIGNPPSQMLWSPDGRHLSYLDGGELVDLDPGTGKPHVLVSREKLSSLMTHGGSERDRDHRQRYGMAGYQWAPDSRHLLFDSDGNLWLYDLRNGVGLQMGYSGQAAGDDPKFAPDGNSISFIHDHGVAVIHLHELGTPTEMIAPAPNPATLCGAVDWVYEEELDTRSNYFWSPDSKSIAFLQMNESEVPLYPLIDWIPVHAQIAAQRYPQPGDPNPDVRVGVISTHGGRVAWIKLPIQPGQDYIPRFGWVNDKTLWIETLTRDQKHRDLYFADTGSGESRLVLEILDDKFVDENYDVEVGNGSIVLTNWSDGHNHLYLYSYNKRKPDSEAAKMEKQLTSGDFEVSGVYRVDFDNRFVDYASNEGNPLEQQVWRVSFDGARKQLTAGAGFHDDNFAPAGGGYVDTQSNRLDPPTLRLCASAGKCSVFWQTRALASYDLRPPEELAVKAHDGTTLYATLLLPKDAHDPASVPLIVNPYGGPGPQEVAHRWTENILFDELLAEHGFAVLHADNRGTGSRGRVFAQAAYHNFGAVQLEDQLTVIDAALAAYPQLDPKRLGWWGWSWGGTFTLYAMTHSDRFRAGIAVAPVTDWRDYDSIYTERYLGLPSEDQKAYHDDSVVNSAASLKGRLLLAQGTGDDNVHLGNTVQFVQQLIEAGIPYDLQIYPRKTHSIAGPDVRTHLYDRILAQFEQYLKTAQ